MTFLQKNFKFLREKSGLNQAQLSTVLGFSSGTWNNYERGKSKPNLDDFINISKYFGVSASDLLEKDLEIEASQGNLIKSGEVAEKQQKGNLKGNPMGKVSGSNMNIMLNEKEAEYGQRGLIPITDISVAAGSGMLNEHQAENIDFLRLPPSLLKRGATYISVLIKGPSMSPTLQDGGYVIIRLLDRSEWAKMPDERIFVVSDMEGKSYLKRVKNRFKQGFIVLKSDNPDQATFPNFNLQADEINTIWYAEWYFTAKMPNIHDQYYSRLQRLEDTVEMMLENQKRIKGNTT